MTDNRTYSEEQLEAYNKGWARFMVQIFQEQIGRLRISDSGALLDSIKELTTTGTVTTIEHRFLQYGLYAAAGVGKGFAHGNGGELLFMGIKDGHESGYYGRRQVGSGVAQGHMLSPKFERKTIARGPNAGRETAFTSGNRRHRRDWVMKKYYYSLRRLNETNARFYGEAYQGITSSFLEAIFGNAGENNIRSNRF